MNKKSLRVYIPAIIVSLVSLALIIYASLTMSPHTGGHPVGAANGELRPHDGNSLKGIFNNIGNIAIVLGAISFLWLIFKKKMTSQSKVVKKIGKKIYTVHTYMGWASLIFTMVHGAYYLLDFQNHKYLSGVAAFLLLLTLGVYGWLTKRFRNKFMRTSHLALSYLWIGALLLHAGGFTILVVGISLLIWALLTVVDLGKRTKSSHKEIQDTESPAPALSRVEKYKSQKRIS